MKLRLEIASPSAIYVLFDPASFPHLASLGSGQYDAMAEDVRLGRAFSFEGAGPGVVFEVFHEEEPPAEVVRRASASVRDLRLELPEGKLHAGPITALPFVDRASSTNGDLPAGRYRLDAWMIRAESPRVSGQRDALLGVGCIVSLSIGIGLAIGLLFAQMYWTAGLLLAATIVVWTVILGFEVARDARQRLLVVVRLAGPTEEAPAEGGTLRAPRLRANR